MAELAIDLRSSHRVEADGSHTVLVEITGIPSLELANGISIWVRDMIPHQRTQNRALGYEPLACAVTACLAKKDRR